MAVDTLVLDIEGTICPITFVKDTLFPYFLEKLPDFLQSVSFPLDQKGDDVQKILHGLPEEVKHSRESSLEYLEGLVKADVKDPVLKSLQGYIWKTGYESGELKAPIYEDSIKFIREYPSKNTRIYIYSSGSIKAQILLFAYVNDNGKSVDLNPFLSGYYDITTAGFKQELTSYQTILKDISREDDPATVLFLSDNVAEVEAAKASGMQSYIVKRPGNAPLTNEDLQKHKVIESLEELNLV
ncbi:2,3-diketo-5-methylthio-1-phosphopentane phosphatase [Suhomyces tanzawaensis NRRL Y-17324]|uniref:Enolase-phosphatase E1 n=1 Tax=Suhomyces tanzawaensis NRRL Y-17324 TaxID=984487 RepID=A0A1E4SCV7_9ASCO|nr:2,3-diketo-5-methylthio-1-phosphopentane phosphatase [Suhomyces tanzawaensis NRRL Y-17324]ODV77298.1 2,3-diketo-5-methylthio-1-phosphopentane phosphatase [Suhomyces tanzawaensis NRRL Y-17324]